MNFSYRIVLLFAALLGAGIHCFAQTQAASPVAPPPQIVRLNLIATDRSNHSVEDLRQEDVQVVEDKIPRTISLFSRDVRPVDYAIVIDTSGSFRQLISPVVEAAKLIINSNTLTDETFIERFISSDKIERIQEFTSDRAKLLGALDTLYAAKGQSAVIDAVYLAVSHTAAHNKTTQERRRAVVLFTDGEDRASYYGDDKLTKLLREKDVQVFVIGIVKLLSEEGGLIRPSPREAAEKLLRKIADESGGRFFLPKNNEELLHAAKEVAHDLHFQYLIDFEHPGKPGEKGFRKVTVKFAASPNREQLKLITRPGYLVNVQNAPTKPQEQTSP